MTVKGVDYPRVGGDAIPLPNGRYVIMHGNMVRHGGAVHADRDRDTYDRFGGVGVAERARLARPRAGGRTLCPSAWQTCAATGGWPCTCT